MEDIPSKPCWDNPGCNMALSSKELRKYLLDETSLTSKIKATLLRYFMLKYKNFKSLRSRIRSEWLQFTLQVFLNLPHNILQIIQHWVVPSQGKKKIHLCHMREPHLLAFINTQGPFINTHGKGRNLGLNSWLLTSSFLLLPLEDGTLHHLLGPNAFSCLRDASQWTFCWL